VNDGFPEALAVAAGTLDTAIDATLKAVRETSPAEAAGIAHRALEELRSAKEAFDSNFAESIQRLERVESGSHEPVPPNE